MRTIRTVVFNNIFSRSHVTTNLNRGAKTTPRLLACRLKTGKVILSDFEVVGLTILLRRIAGGRDVALPQPGRRMNSLHP